MNNRVKLIWKILILTLIVSLLSACSSSKYMPTATIAETPIPSPTPYEPMPQGSNGYSWWNDVVFYEIFVRSFADSNGDGIGDFHGLTNKLDYLNDGDPNTTTDLGINAIWLMPVFVSPSYHGYDVTDYYQINPDYGTMDDFQLFMKEAHKRGIRVILDFVINHTSVEHPWFKDARSDVNSPYRDWYIWSDTNPGYLGPWGEKVWHFNYDNSFYYGVFSSGMPDLNFNNQAVTDEIYKIASFWMDEQGVDGFRVDGARHLIEEGQVQANTAETYQWFENFYQYYKQNHPNFFTIGEVWDSNFAAAKYVKEKAFDLVFDFELSDSIIAGLNNANGKKIRNALDFNTHLYPPLQKANFLTNHDMNRIMNALLEDPQRAKMAAFLLLTAPGVPFIYYGEEIGMLGIKPDENIRRPMQWDSTEYAGFSTFLPWEPLSSNSPKVNVQVENDNPDSLLTFYRNMIQIRNQHEALRTGDYLSLDTSSGDVIAYIRQSNANIILLILNVGNSEHELSIEIPDGTLLPGEYTISSLLSVEEFPNLLITGNGTSDTYLPSNSIQPDSFIMLSIAAK